jgi:1,4-dihydroxy-2-naphthoate polyprenyltransferase
MRFPLTHPPLGIAERGDRSILLGLWRLADPKIAVASLVPFCVGAALAWRDTQRIDIGLAAAAFLVLFLVEVGKNAVNDLYDFRSGADTAVLPNERTPYSGGKRVLVDRVLTEADLIVIAWMAFAAAGVLGFLIAFERQPLLLLLGAAAALVSVLYSMPPVQLSYRGLGELAVAAVYGPGIVLGSLLLFGGTVTAEALDASLILGILIAVVLLTNELPDERTDRVAGKRTLVVRMGRDLATSLIGFLFAIAFVIPLLTVAYGEVVYFLGALLGVPFSYVAYILLRREFDRPPVAGQTATLITYVVSGLGLAIGTILL